MKNAAVVTMVVLLTVALGNDAVAGKRFDLGDVKGRYVFSFDGEINGGGPVAASGYLEADGRGNIYMAKRTISSQLGSVTETFTCTLTLDSDGMGSAVCPLDDPRPESPIESFDFVIAQDRQSFQFVGTTPGLVIRGSGHR
ncbi:MAG: hypothetical protein ACM3ST_14870 [Bdellovibrio bacteriovorus]